MLHRLTSRRGHLNKPGKITDVRKNFLNTIKHKPSIKKQVGVNKLDKMRKSNLAEGTNCTFHWGGKQHSIL